MDEVNNASSVPELDTDNEREPDPQLDLFHIEPAWKDVWVGMPEFEHKDLEPWQSIKVHFRTREDRTAFGRLINQKVSNKTRFVWYPEAQITSFKDKQYASAKVMNPIYPVYIISKGRWDTRLTAKALDKIEVPYRIVVEPQEYGQYAAVIDPDRILVLPFSNLGQGSIPARNWVWEHSISEGHKRHWILDDNIRGFYRFNRNLKIPATCGNVFRVIEEFSDRYTNVHMSGMNYFMFASRKCLLPPLTLNTRIYSCILLNNDCSFRWRGRYNEDTDLSIRILKSGACTVLFNALLAYKETTMTMKGGNSDELYKDDGRLKMAKSLEEQHPDIVKTTWKWNRWQHQVDYRGFKDNKLIFRPDFVMPEGSNEFGMEFQMTEGPEEDETITP